MPYSPLLFNFTLEYAIRKVQETNLGLDMNGTHQVLTYSQVKIDISYNKYSDRAKYLWRPRYTSWNKIPKVPIDPMCSKKVIQGEKFRFFLKNGKFFSKI